MSIFWKLPLVARLGLATLAALRAAESETSEISPRGTIHQCQSPVNKDARSAESCLDGTILDRRWSNYFSVGRKKFWGRV